MSLIQISTCTPAHRPTSWAKTPPSHALWGLPPARTTSARTALEIIGSMVGMLRRCVLRCYKAPLCLRNDYWHSRSWKQLTHSFRRSFYTDAMAEKQGPHLQGNSQRATKFTVLVTLLHSYTCTHTRTHAQRECLSPFVYVSRLRCFTATDGLSCINSCHQDLNPYTPTPHFTTAQSAVFGLALSVSLTSERLGASAHTFL